LDVPVKEGWPEAVIVPSGDDRRDRDFPDIEPVPLPPPSVLKVEDAVDCEAMLPEPATVERLETGAVRGTERDSPFLALELTAPPTLNELIVGRVPKRS